MIETFGENLSTVEKIINIILAIIAVKLIIYIGSFIIRGFFQARKRVAKEGESRFETLRILSLSVWRYLMYFVLIAIIVDQLGLGITASSLLATAGIGGLAIGFGAQSLIKDIFAGAFILFEDQMSVGDYVTIAGNTGTVEAIRIRTTHLRAFTGELHIIPNGSINQVTNFSRGKMLALIDIIVSYNADLEKAGRIINEVCTEYAEGNENIVSPPELQGTVSVSEAGITLRIICHTKPMQQFGVERELRQRIIEAFKLNDIGVPYRTMFMINKSKED